MINNIYDFENKLDALKISGRYIGCKTSDFYIDYYIQFEPSVTINRIKSRVNDLSMILGAPVTIEVINNSVVLRCDNTNRNSYILNDFIKDPEINHGSGLNIPIGINENNERVFYDLTRAPHMLVAGSTGSGKSVFLNNAIISLLYQAKSELVLIDCKKVEFSLYDNIGGAISEVITTPEDAATFLCNACDFMDQRYDDMKKNHCRTFLEYKALNPEENYITIIIDELADLLIQNRKQVEKHIIRLASLGRAAGIHLILATQRPSADVITGLIKDNIPTRVCFSVPSAISSRIVIDQSGGEKLRGRGDGLFKPIDKNTLTRFQAPFISTQDIIKSLEIYKNLVANN